MQKRFPFFWAGSVFDHMDYYRRARNRRKRGFKRGYESNGIRAEMMKNHWKRPKKVFGSCLGPRGRWFETSHSDQKTRWNHKISAGFLCKLFDFFQKVILWLLRRRICAADSANWNLPSAHIKHINSFTCKLCCANSSNIINIFRKFSSTGIHSSKTA